MADPTTPPEPTPPTLDEQRLQALREQTAAIREQTAAMIAAQRSAEALAQALTGAQTGLSEAFVMDLLRVVLNRPATTTTAAAG